MTGIHFNIRLTTMRHSIQLVLIIAGMVASNLSNAQIHSCKHNQQLRFMNGSERSDTVDVKHYDIALDFTQASAFTIAGICTVTIEPLMEVDQLVFDFEGLTLDSVKIENTTCTFQQSQQLVVVQANNTLLANEELEVDFYYHGQPQQDPSGWGGFYFQNSYAYNLGVGFEGDPHSYGRIWHPCFDNFVERATYTLRVLTSDNKKSYCGGVLTSETITADTTLRVWELEQTIPAYLASVSTGNYVHATRSFESISGEDIPVWLTAQAMDTLDMVNSFENLIPALDAFEADFGPYRWPRVGYVGVPFSGGAMEHACNIAYPLFAANGSLANQTLMAHELSHHWWGNLVTCSTQEDMWINEGMASFCEALFIEAVEGYDAYLQYVRDNHRDVLLYAHRRDGERLPVSGIGHANTYGDHVYNKGADVAYNLRTYLGDDYFALMTSFLEDHQFSAVSSEDLRDYLQNGTSADLTSFFENWIFNPGFPEFREANILSTNNGDGTFTVNYRIDQYKHYNPDYYENVPLEVTFIGPNGDEVIEEILVGIQTDLQTSLPFEPVHVVPNKGGKINEAVLSEELTIESTGIKQFNFSEFRIDVDVLDSPMDLIVENHWAEADNSGQPQYSISTDRFWRIRGLNSDAFAGTGRIRMYGAESATNYFDPLFSQQLLDLNYTEDSLIVVYRPKNTTIWQALNTSINTQGADNNFQCYADFPMLGDGDYALAYHTGETGLIDIKNNAPLIYPNPTHSHLFLGENTGNSYQIFDHTGRLMQEGIASSQLDVSQLPPGSYSITVGHSTTLFIKH